MKIVKVALKENAYNIVIGTNILPRLGDALSRLNIGKDAVVVTTPPIRRHHGRALSEALYKSGFTVKVFEVPDGEKSKSFRIAFGLMEQIARYDHFRKIFIVAFGGGVVGDLAGYVAAAYKRGIPYVQVPTTFLAQIDSAIGGKTAVDLSVGKNLVGAFYQPKLVYSDAAVLSTLKPRQIRNGLAEAVKYGVICDKKLFDYLARNYQRLLDRDIPILQEVVVRCSRIKAEVVCRDEKETKGIRTILNFGHTIGHAIEAAGGYRLYHHGEAVALGMRAAAEISVAYGMMRRMDAAALNQLLSAIGLPEKIEKVRLEDILRLMQHDKKFQGGTTRFVLAKGIGGVQVVDDVPLALIQKSIRLFF